jgi:competence protein ComEC
VRIVAAVPASALIAGAAVGLLVSDPPSLLLYIALASALVAATSAWRLQWSRRFLIAVASVFFLGGALLGIDAWARAWRPPLRIAFERLADNDEWFATLQGTLRADASPTATGVSLSVDVESVARFFQTNDSDREGSIGVEREGFSRASGGVLLTVVGSLAPQAIGEWRAGRRVRLPVTLRRPSRYLDPGVPDHERALARRGTTLVGTVKSAALVEVVARGSWIDESLSATRAYSRRAIADAVGRWSPQSAAIVAAIVIGDRAGLDPDVQRRLQEAGTYHVIAISGGNIAILAGLLIGGFRLAGWLGRAAMLASIALLIAYAALVGGGASVDRATLMAVVYLAGRVGDQRAPPLNTFALVAGLLVATNPLSIADPAFVLTFGATLAILVVVPAATARHQENIENHEDHESTKTTKADLPVTLSCVSWLREKAGRPMVTMLAASIAAEAILFPVGAIVFSRVTFAGLALNFVAIPLMGVAQIAGMLVVPFALVSHSLAQLAGWVAHVGAAGLVWSADLVRFAPAITYRIAAPPVTAVVVYYSALVVAWRLARSRARVLSRAFAVIATGAAIWILVDPRSVVAARGDGSLHVTFIDVGQGDAAFVRFPWGSTLVVDAGGLSFSSAFDIGDRVVAPVIRDSAIRHVDYVALTHGDPDHIGGAPAILREFRPREVWEGIPVPRAAPLTALRVAAEQQGARWANVFVGDRVVVDDVAVIVRHPEPPDWERQKVRNDDSIVIELRWRDVSIVLTGDIGKAVERRIAATIPPARLRVVKVPHHGSLTSSTAEFVDALHPQIAVVSVGRGNHYGHPAREVLERYWSVGAEVFRTDEDGAVMVDSDGMSLTVHTFTGRAFSTHEMHESTKHPK